MSKASLIISVYKNTRALELIFYALSMQSEKDFDIIVAEDGNFDEIKGVIESAKNILPNKIIHITQEDIGFRKNKILNEAIRADKTGYMIFIDGDCIPHPDFIKAHIDSREKNTILCGRRVALGKKPSGELTKEKILSREYEKMGLRHFLDSLSGDEGSKHVEEGLRLSLFNKKSDVHILGCNFSIWKEMLERINGFDENYEGPGLGEDSDIEFRLRLTGAEFRSVRNKAIQYHFYHPKTKEAETNFDYFQRVKEKGEFWAEKGLK